MDVPSQLCCPTCGYSRPMPKYLTDVHIACPNCHTPLVRSRGGADHHDLLELIECDLFTLSSKIANSLKAPRAETIVREMAQGHTCEALIESLDWTDHEQIEETTLLSLFGCCVSRIIESIMADDVVMDDEVVLAHQLCRPIADLFAAHFDDYAPFTDLTVPMTREFFSTFQNDQRWFAGSPESEPDIVAGILCGAATVASGDQALMNGYELLFETVAMRILAVDGVTAEEEATFLRFKDHAKAIRELIDIHMRRQATKSRAPDPKRSIERSSSRLTFDMASQALAELNALVGIAGVKKEVQRLMGQLTVQKARQKHNCRGSSQPLHFAFTGNPGTGKTTVARLLSKILYGWKVLTSPKTVEQDARKLLGISPADTALKIDAAFKAAAGGMLFLEEPYLLSRSAAQAASAGDEAMSMLVKRMQDCGSQTVVVLAGQSAPMAEFLTAHPDLKSLMTRSIHFDDYEVADLCRIFEKFAVDDEYALTPNARAYAFLHFSLVHERRDANFGNARVVRRCYEDALSFRTERLAAKSSAPTPEQLKLLEGADIMSSSLYESELRSRDVSSSKWEAECPGCHRTSQSGVANLGRRVTCKCGASFVFPWWNLVRSSIPGLTTQPEGVSSAGKSVSAPFV
jgi:hypothetical protein